MLYVGLDLSRTASTFHALLPDRERLARRAVPPDADGLARLVRRLGKANEPVLVKSQGVDVIGLCPER